MSHTIDDGIRDNARTSIELTKIKEAYPDAFLGSLPDGRIAWMSYSVVPDDVMLINDEKGEGYFCTLTHVGRTAVFSMHTQFQVVVLADLRKTNSEAFKALVKAVGT